MLDLYFRLPPWLQSLALSAYGLRLRWHRYGHGHERKVGELLSRERWTGEEVLREQHRQLARTLEHAATAVPYYRDAGFPLPDTPDDAYEALRSWPLLEKKDVQAAGRAMLADSHRRERLTEIHTGGTTGRALTIWCDRPARATNFVFFERFKRWAGVGRRDRVATFAGRPIVPPDASEPPYWRHNLASRQLLCSSYHISPESMDDYIGALERFQPVLIDSYPSSIEPIARAILAEGGGRVAPKALITSSETLFPEVRAILEDAFTCRVFDHYGSAEMVAFVTQCEQGGYHPNPEYGLLEVLRPDGSPAEPGEEGEIVATGFLNRAMPLIRYRMGDLAVRSWDPCACGRPYPTLSGLRGRVDDVIVTPTGRRVGRLDPIFKAVDTLYEARIVQTALDHVRLEVVSGDDFGAKDRDELVLQLRLRLGGDMRIEVVELDSIPRSVSGKLRTVVSPFARPTKSPAADA